MLDTQIKDTRIKYGLSIKQVSDLTGIPYRSLQNWEGGQRKCPDYVTGMITNILDQKFGRPDHETFLEQLLEMFMVDVNHAKTEETRKYITNLISDISEHLDK